jgi:hypothetical protein
LTDNFPQAAIQASLLLLSVLVEAYLNIQRYWRQQFEWPACMLFCTSAGGAAVALANLLANIWPRALGWYSIRTILVNVFSLLCYCWNACDRSVSLVRCIFGLMR